jgi:NAD(P)-dependent dehydrogenase (short-subunit alcohol dehydrogenase family)
MIMGKLTGKVAVITGATTGMALATAKLFVKEGAYVFITGRRQEQLDAAVKEIGSNVIGVRCDSGNLADLDRLFEIVKKEKGHIDVLFASAGVGWWVPIEQVTLEHYDKTFDVNVKGTLFTMAKALPLLKDGASVILNASIAASKGMDAFSVYAASKAAVRSFARSWTTDLKQRKIRVNALSPGPIDTASLAPLPGEAREQLQNAVPLGRLGKSEEIATAALFLASDDSSFITGIELFVDGGMAQI